MRRDRSIAICHSDLKQSALYFDVVCPSSESLWCEIAGLHDEQTIGCDLLMTSLLGRQPRIDRRSFFASQPLSETHHYVAQSLGLSMIEILHESHVEKRYKDAIYITGEQSSGSEFEERLSPSLILTSMKLVDVDRLQWDQIVALRKDQQAISALNDLKNLIISDYSDKPFSFIEDQLAKRIERHEAVIRKWGMNTLETSLELMLSHKNTAALAGFASTVFGVPFSSAVVLGASATLANVGFHLRRRQRQKHELMNHDPTRYVFNARRLIDQ